MAKTQSQFVCQGCGHISPRWMGKCTECEAWNSFVEEIRKQDGRSSAPNAASILPSGSSRPVAIRDVPLEDQIRQSTGISELDRVLGGGLVSGAVVLVGGDPGIGKSTLMTQAALKMTTTQKLLYVSGEESARQIKLRCDRLSQAPAGFFALNETDIHSILLHIDQLQPDCVVVDSIQTTYDPALESAPGSVSQIRNCASAFTRLAKNGGPPIILIGHVTKEGTLAGPRVLEHMVDTVLYFEGDRQHAYRVLRAVKNRFGSTDEIGVFEMNETGLHEVANPSAALLAERTAGSCGSAVACTMEGTRPLLVEVQALVARSFLANPRRTANGVDMNRLHMLLAVLEKRMGLRLGEQDVYVNAAGGIKIVEPASDLALTMAVASSFRDQPIEPQTILLGEVGLGGEVRAVSQTEKRLREASRLGFNRAIISRNDRYRGKIEGLKVVTVGNVLEAMQLSLLSAK